MQEKKSDTKSVSAIVSAVNQDGQPHIFHGGDKREVLDLIRNLVLDVYHSESYGFHEKYSLHDFLDVFTAAVHYRQREKKNDSGQGSN